MDRIVSLGALGLVAGALVGCGAPANGESGDVDRETQAVRNPVGSDTTDPDSRTVPVRQRPVPTDADPAPAPTSSPVGPSVGPVGTPPASIADAYYGDLVVGPELGFADEGDLGILVSIEVTNVGNSPLSAASGLVSVGLAPCSAAWFNPYPGPTTAPGGKGYILTLVPHDLIAVCKSYTVSIDIDHTMQFEQHHTGVFTNDTAQTWAPCLTWETVITSRDLQHDPDNHLKNHSIQDIVGSYVSVLDGPTCSHCHYAGGPYPYSPPVARDGFGIINRTDVIGGKTWAGSNGWASEFAKHPDVKRAYMLDLFSQWSAYGWR